MKLGLSSQQNTTNQGTTGKTNSHLEIARFGSKLLLQLSCQGFKLDQTLLGKFGHSDGMIRLRLWNSSYRDVYMSRRFDLENVSLATDL